MESRASKVQIEISRDLYDKVKQRVSTFNDEFKSVEEYVAFVLTEVLRDEEEHGSAYTRKEEEEIKSRLKSLGYI